MDTDRDESKEEWGLAERIERVTEASMTILALLYIPVVVLILLSYVPDRFLPIAMPGFIRSAEFAQDVKFAEYVIVAVFAAELVLRVAVEKRRLEYLRSYWLDVAIVLFVPILLLTPSSLLPVSVLRLLSVVPFLVRGVDGVRRIMGQGAFVLFVGVASVLGSATLMILLEQESKSEIKGFDDALWWAATTITTIGYGDMAPATPEGRAIAIFLMLIGVALFGVLTAAITQHFVGGPDETVLKKLEDLELRIKEQNQLLADFKRDPIAGETHERESLQERRSDTRSG